MTYPPVTIRPLSISVRINSLVREDLASFAGERYKLAQQQQEMYVVCERCCLYYFVNRTYL